MPISTSVRVDDAKMRRLDAVARARGISRSAAISEAVDAYLDYQEWFAAQVRKGVDDIAAGRIADPEDVKAVFRKYGVEDA